jgi:hypothetical protein
LLCTSQQQLALLHGVAEPGFDFYHSTRGQRDYGDSTRDIGLHHAGDIQDRRFMLNRRHQWKLVGMIHFEVVGIQIRLDGRFRRRFSLRVWFRPHIASQLPISRQDDKQRAPTSSGPGESRTL